MARVNNRKIDFLKVIAVVILAIGILCIDFQIPLGVAIGVAYVLPLLITFWFHNSKSTIYFSSLFTIFILVGFSKHFNNEVPWIFAIANRTLSLLVVWVCSFFLWKLKENSKQLEEQSESFKNASIELKQQLDTLNSVCL